MQHDVRAAMGITAPMREHWHLAYVRRVMDETQMNARTLAKRAGIAPTTITRALNSEEHKFNLSLTTLEKIRDATGVPFVVGDPLAASQVAGDEEMVAVYDVAASAGHGAMVESEQVLCNLAFDRSFLRRMTSARSQDLAIIRVKGHSMEPTLLDDDHVLVDKTKKNLSYDGLFVIRFDDALHVKRVGRSAARGNVMVISDHPAYRDLDMPKEDLDVVGRVLWVGRKV